MSLEQLIDDLSKIGRIFLHQHDDGSWSCTISIGHQMVPGVEGKIRSDFGHKTPVEAGQVCLERARKAFKSSPAASASKSEAISQTPAEKKTWWKK